MADEGPIKRLNYFKHQFLKVEDFLLEQNYHVNMRRRHNRYMHTWGVADGLRVTAAQGATEVKVSKGMAVDSEGREIILPEEKTLPLGSFDANTPVYVVISYAEKLGEPSNETGATGDRRVIEEPNLRAVTQQPKTDAGTNIVLAKVNRNAQGQNTGTPDETDRHSVGVEASELTVRRLSLRPATDMDIGLWPRLTCVGANQAALENGSLKLDNGREIVFDATVQASGSASGQAVGQLRSSDNAHRINFNRANNRMEFYDSGDILLLTGSPNPVERLRVSANGNVGIGTPAPGTKLEIRDGDLLFKAAAEDPGDIIFQNSAGAQKARIASFASAGAGLNLSTADNVPRLTIGPTGNVGVGTTDPKYLLSFANALGDKIALWGSADAHYGFGIQGSLLQIYTDGQGSDVAFGFGSSASFTETARIKGNGRVGIGTPTPGAKLEINDGDLLFKAAAEDPGDIVFQNSAGVQKARIFSPATAGAGLNLAVGDNTARLTIAASGAVGIGTQTPGGDVLLDVNGRMRTRTLNASTTAGMWLTGSAGKDRAFVGLWDDDNVGIWSSDKQTFGFSMEISTFKIKSPMWRAFQILTAVPGGLPKKDVKFTTNGGLVILFVSGSGWTPTGGAQIGMSIKVDDVERGKARGFSNEASSHKTFVPVQLVLALAAGEHRLTLDALAGTSTDGNDFYNVTAVEMPINPEPAPFINIFNIGNIGIVPPNIG